MLRSGPLIVAHSRLVTPYLVAVLVLWAVYRRARRSFGRQRVRERLIWARIGILALLCGLAAIGTGGDVSLLAGLLAGIGCGAALSYLGLRHTQFEVTPEGRYYRPHAYIGVAVIALFVGRLLYRFLSVTGGAIPAGGAGGGLAASYRQSPLTLAMFGALVGYYVLYYLGVLQKTRLTPPVGVSR